MNYDTQKNDPPINNEVCDHDWWAHVGLDVPMEDGRFYTGIFQKCALCGARGRFIDDPDEPGEQAWQLLKPAT